MVLLAIDEGGRDAHDIQFNNARRQRTTGWGMVMRIILMYGCAILVLIAAEALFTDRLWRDNYVKIQSPAEQTVLNVGVAVPSSMCKHDFYRWL